MSEGTSAVEPRSEQPAQLRPVGAMRRYDIAAALLWLITAALTVSSLIIVTRPAEGEVPGRPAILDLLVTLAVVLAYASVGALLVSRRPRNLVGWLLTAVGLCVGVSIFASSYAGLALVVNPGALPGGAVAAWLVRVSGVLALILGGPVLILLFPDGRLPSARWRPVAWVLLAGTVLSLVNLAFAPGPVSDFPVDNPLGIDPYEPFVRPVDGLTNVLLTIATVGAVLSIVARFRRGDAIERQQLKWFGYWAAVVAALLVLAMLLLGSPTEDAAFNVFVLSLAGLPIAVGIAVLRYRLYDIDRLIGRTLVYVPLTAFLAGLYTASVSLFQRLFVAISGDKSDAAIVLATLVLATTFTPIRKWLEGIVDRRLPPEPATASPESAPTDPAELMPGSRPLRLASPAARSARRPAAVGRSDA